MSLPEKIKNLSKEELKNLLVVLQEKQSVGEFLKFLEVLQFQCPAHYKEWNKLLKSPRVAIESARDHGKTTFFSISYPLWKIATTPNYHVCIISYAEDQSKKILRELRIKVETTPVFSDMVPVRWKPGSWGKTEIHLLNRSYVQAKSFGSSMRGGHYDLVIVDDPLKDRSSMPIEQQEEIFFGVISPAVKPTGQLIVVGTPVKFGDLFDALAKNSRYVHARFPAIDSDGKALWSDRYSLERLEERKKELQHYWLFAREYLLQRIDPEGAPFKSNWFKYYDEPPKKMVTLMSVDPAITYQGDYTGIVITGTDQDSNTYVLSTRKLRTANVNEIVETIIQLAKQYNVRRMLIEAIGFQRLLKFWILKEMAKTDYWVSTEEIKSHKESKNHRILALQPKIEMGKLLFKDSQTQLFDEFMSFPKGQNDDLIDALSMQVGRWSTPDADPTSVPEGSFHDIFSKSKDTRSELERKLFEDLIEEPETSNILLK